MFELLNTKWGEPTFGTPSGTITWSEDIGGDLALAGGTSDGDILDALNAAFDRWESVAAVDFQQVSSGADVLITTASLNEGREIGDPFVAGQAFYGPVFSGLNSLSSGRVEFADELLWSEDGVGGTNFYAVALHEIGHILGLGHPMPEDRSEIMNATIYATDLGDGDIRGIQEIYGTDGASAAPLSGGGGGGGGALGLLLGLLALLASLFTGGGGAAVAMAAGRVAHDDNDDDEVPGQADALLDQFHVHDSGCGHGHEGAHQVYAAETYVEGLPMIDMSDRPNPCGCVGLCEHLRGETCEDGEDGFLV
ncbi:MAG: matrixin family metalloprotease [Paracoccaceae bacterium]|nr:matrixin family metalloprotease [Paracoccaceae bacterium]